MASQRTLRLGTRGSPLARAQSKQVADELMSLHAGLVVELITVQTSGDIAVDTPLADAGGKGLFTKELDLALLDGRIDFAVHSYKDVPVTQPLVDVSTLRVAAVPRREDPRDVLVVADRRAVLQTQGIRETKLDAPRPAASPPTSRVDSVGSPGAAQTKPRTSARAFHPSLPAGATVGTSSLRRAAQVLSVDPSASIVPLRGNIDTRLRKLANGEADAILLAAAGLIRAGLMDPQGMILLEPEALLPAAGQGALALMCRQDDAGTIQLLKRLDDPKTRRCVDCERAIVAELRGDCHSPIAALASPLDSGGVSLWVRVATRGGFPPILEARASGPVDKVVSVVLTALRAQNVESVLHDVR